MPAKDAKCNCDMPIIVDMSNLSYLGRETRIRLCCLTTFIEQLYEVDLHETRDIEPMYSWNEELANQPIPQFIADRIEQKRQMGFKMDAPRDPGHGLDKSDKNREDPMSVYRHNIHKYIRNVKPNDTGRKKLFKEEANRARESWLAPFVVAEQSESNGKGDT